MYLGTSIYGMTLLLFHVYACMSNLLNKDKLCKLNEIKKEIEKLISIQM